MLGNLAVGGGIPGMPEARENGANGCNSSGGSGSEVGGFGPTAGGFAGEEDKGRVEEGDRSSGGNRWPRQETLALLKIRSDMDAAFRDSSLKGPLWEDVSRKLADLGYHRSAKKCKEKFENVYKYHRRTKEGRASKSDGKTYRFFDQLEALDTTATATATHAHHPPPQPLMTTAVAVATTTAAVAVVPTVPPVTQMSMLGTNIPQPMPIGSQHVTTSTNYPISTIPQTTVINPTIPSLPLPPQPPPPQPLPLPTSVNNHHHHTTQTNAANHHFGSNNYASFSSSSSTSSDEEPERRRKKKRKWEDYFDRLMKEVMEKQEEMQRKFLDTLEKRERDRISREEAWRAQEIARMNREHDIMVQERSTAAAKDAAVVTFLQKMSEQQNSNSTQPPLPLPLPLPAPVSLPIQMPVPLQQHPISIPQQPPVQQQQPSPPPPPPQENSEPIPQPQTQIQSQSQSRALQLHTTPPPAPKVAQLESPKTDNGGSDGYIQASSSRWPKAEVEALISLRTNLDLKYQENGPKGPLWEEISSAMKRIGYNRSSKRCKEKWENINKYFKKVKESNKKRPEDSKTCPYFQQLDALYKVKNKPEITHLTQSQSQSQFNPGLMHNKIENPLPIMVRPEQQWPLPREQAAAAPMEEDRDSDNMEHDDDEGDDDEDECVAGYQIVANKPHSMVSAGE